MEEVKVVALTAKTARVLEILKENGARMFAEEIAAVDPSLFEKGARSVSPIMTHLVKNGFVEKAKVSKEVLSSDGNKVTKEYTQYWVSPVGAALDYQIKA